MLQIRRGAPPSYFNYDLTDNRQRLRGTQFSYNALERLTYQANWLTLNIGSRSYGLSKYRIYDPELGIFLSRDFLPYLNLYRAWSNNPVGQVDPSGLLSVDSANKLLKSAQERVMAAKESVERRRQDVARSTGSPINRFSRQLLASAEEFLEQKNRELALAEAQYNNAREQEMENLRNASSRNAKNSGQKNGTNCRRIRIASKSWINEDKIGFSRRVVDGTEYWDQGALANFVLLVKALSEGQGDTPEDDLKYRLYTSMEFLVCCDGNDNLTFSILNQVRKTGPEGPFQPDSGRLYLTGDRTSNRSHSVSWEFQGRPKPIAEYAFNFNKTFLNNRTSVYIWHKVQGVFTCECGVVFSDFKIRGSRFPTHTLFVDGEKIQQIEQRYMDDLWVPVKQGSDIVR